MPIPYSIKWAQLIQALETSGLVFMLETSRLAFVLETHVVGFILKTYVVVFITHKMDYGNGCNSPGLYNAGGIYQVNITFSLDIISQWFPPIFNLSYT